MNSVDPVVKVLAGLDHPANPTVEFKDALLARLLAELRPAAEPRSREDMPWRFHSLPAVRWPHGRRRRVIALVAALLVVAVGTAAAIGSVREFFLDRGFIGLPPLGVTPSAPESGDLVLRSEFDAAPLSPEKHGTDVVRAWLYADGRIIWDRRPFHGKRGIPEGANEFTSGYLEQRLTSEGVELVRAAVAELFDRSRTLVVTIPAEEELWTGIANVRSALFVPKDYADNTGIVAVPDGDRQARLHVRGIATKNDHAGGRLVGEIVEGTLATPEQISALRRVHALLTDPASVLPSSAWAEQKVRAYVPSHYAVCIDTSPPKEASELLSLLPARAADVLRHKSRTRSDAGVTKNYDGTVVETPGVKDCYRVETEEAREVADTLSGLVREQGWGTHWLRWRVDEAVDRDPAEWNPTDITLEPYFPDGRLPFSGPSG